MKTQEDNLCLYTILAAKQQKGCWHVLLISIFVMWLKWLAVTHNRYHHVWKIGSSSFSSECGFTVTSRRNTIFQWRRQWWVTDQKGLTKRFPTKIINNLKVNGNQSNMQTQTRIVLWRYCIVHVIACVIKLKWEYTALKICIWITDLQIWPSKTSSIQAR